MKGKKYLWTIAVLFSIGIVIVLVLSFGNEKKGNQLIELQTSYATLEFPEKYSKSLKHLEIIDNDVIVEVFSMVHSGKEIELFRLYFGEIDEGSREGYLHLDTGVVPVSVVVGDIIQTGSMDDELVQKYYSMVDALSVVLSSLYENENFTKDEYRSQREDVKQLTFWTFRLPESILCEENTENGEYKLTFSFMHNDKQYTLYTVYMSDKAYGSPFGVYMKDDGNKILSLQVDEAVQQGNLPEDVKDNIFAMMDTIGPVMDIITSNEHFSEFEAEE